MKKPCMGCREEPECDALCDRWCQWFCEIWSETQKKYGVTPIKNWKPYRPSIRSQYSVYSRRTGMLICSGSVDECMDRIGLSRSAFYRNAEGKNEGRYRIERNEKQE